MLRCEIELAASLAVKFWARCSARSGPPWSPIYFAYTALGQETLSAMIAFRIGAAQRRCSEMKVKVKETDFRGDSRLFPDAIALGLIALGLALALLAQMPA